MNPAIKQLLDNYKAMKFSKKFFIAAVLGLALAGFITMFYVANEIDYKRLYSNLSHEDAALVVDKLKELKIPYKLEINGTTIKVPVENLNELRLTMAGLGLPKGNSTGFEIFDKVDFGTTEFVQKLNYQRALQGELARTISDFKEIDSAKVMIVMPKESVFMDEEVPPSASILLKLQGKISKEKVSAIVHLVSSSIEGMDPDNVTVVDTSGKVLAKGTANEEESEVNIADSQLQYKITYEQSLSRNIQSMLEALVGDGKAIVRVNAALDFNVIDINQEVFDPEGQVVRSKQNIADTSESKNANASAISSVNPITNAQPGSSPETLNKNEQKDETVNYEIGRTITRTKKPVGILNRLSVAVVIDGTYTYEVDNDGKRIRNFVPRSKEDIERFVSIVKNAMGYDVDREDQITVESVPFSFIDESDFNFDLEKKLDWKSLVKQYSKMFINVFIVMLLLMFVVRPIIKMMKSMADQSLQIQKDEIKKLDEKEKSVAELHVLSPKDKAKQWADKEVDKTATLMKSWLSEK